MKWNDWKDQPVTPPASAPPAATVPGPGLVELAELVGERTVPQLWPENYWFRRHEAAYLSLVPRVLAATQAADAGGGLLIEAGCGEGYGVRLLTRAGIARVAALDYDAATLAHARGTYPEISGRAARANLVRLPLASGSAAAITSFQVIEHLWTPGEFLDECARVLRPGGLLVLATPNRLTFSPGLGRGQKPPNPFHAREFDAAELRELVAGQLEVIDLLGVSHGPRLRTWAEQHGDLIAAQLAGPPEGWPVEVSELVRSVTADDFVLTSMADDPVIEDGVLDLVLLARTGSGE
jgi:SAM-dependent methyltransferase